MIPKQKRISRDKFQSILRSGKVLRGNYVTVHYAPSPYPEVGIVVPKKKIKQASARNRIRRMLYGAYREHEQVEPWYSLVLRVHASIENEELFKKDINTLLHKIYAN